MNPFVRILWTRNNFCALGAIHGKCAVSVCWTKGEVVGCLRPENGCGYGPVALCLWSGSICGGRWIRQGLVAIWVPFPLRYFQEHKDDEVLGHSFKVLEQPKYGRLLRKQANGQTVPVLKFSYTDLLAKRILYESIDNNQADSFKIKVILPNLSENSNAFLQVDTKRVARKAAKRRANWHSDGQSAEESLNLEVDVQQPTSNAPQLAFGPSGPSIHMKPCTRFWGIVGTIHPVSLFGKDCNWENSICACSTRIRRRTVFGCTWKRLGPVWICSTARACVYGVFRWPNCWRGKCNCSQRMRRKRWNSAQMGMQLL